MSDCFLRSVDVDVGVPPRTFQEHQSFKFHFYGFSSLDSTKGRKVVLPPFVCFNHEWQLDLYPGGNTSVKTKDGMTSLFLRHLSENEIAVYSGIVAKSNEGEVIIVSQMSHTFSEPEQSWGWNILIKHSILLKPDNLNEGTLTLELRMKLVETKSGVNFIPTNPFGKHMLKLFLEEESADVLFELSSDSNSSTVQYHAHRLVLEACAPDLARLCEGCDKSTPVAIPDVDPPVFLQLLKYVYGGKVTADWARDAKKFIDAADKYDVGLKIEAEAWYVTYCNFTVDNVIEELLYADAKNCPLLREAAIDFILKNTMEVIQSDSFENILMTKTITKEIMLAMASAEQGNNDSSDKKTDESVAINDLRMALYEKGLDIDGSREVLTSRLEN
mmetsp:Transcript_11349/g.20884  ORF Transcript_11349/g.20884 Transcript_11349/m.20884 type:complete len:387 (-) Transcript_11349:228-1388(-)